MLQGTSRDRRYIHGGHEGGEETGSIKKALPPNRLVNVPLSPGGSGIITSTSVVLPLRTGEAYCSTPATPELRGCRLIRLFGPRRSRTGSLTAQLAVRFPVSASVVPLPYSPCNGSPIYTLGCGFGNASFLEPISKTGRSSLLFFRLIRV